MFYNSEEFNLFRVKHNDIAPSKGKILISMPFLQDSNFKKSVIVLTEHNTLGTFGFVLNKLAGYNISDVLSDIPPVDMPVGFGGPVEKDTLHFIHTLGDQIPDSLPISENLFWGGDIDVVKTLLSDNVANKHNIRFFVGYAGWAPKQLSDEIQSDTWLVSSLETPILFNSTKTNLWKLALTKLGKKYSYWTSFPDNPNLN